MAFENFPYTNFHELNLDWIAKIAKDFLEQYTQIQNTITQGLEDLDNKAAALQALLDEWYKSHSEDIANQLAQALSDLNDWYTTHENYLNETLQTNINRLEAKGNEVIESIPSNYTELEKTVDKLDRNITIYDNILRGNYTNGQFYSTGYGDTSNSSYLTTFDTIPLTPNSVYSFRNIDTHFTWLRTGDPVGVRISTLATENPDGSFSFSTPDTTTYIYLYTTVNTNNIDRAIIIKGNNIPANVEHTTVIIPDLYDEYINDLKENIKIIKNLVADLTVTNGKFYSSGYGDMADNSAMFVFQSIQLKPNTFYSCREINADRTYLRTGTAQGVPVSTLSSFYRNSQGHHWKTPDTTQILTLYASGWISTRGNSAMVEGEDLPANIVNDVTLTIENNPVISAIEEIHPDYNFLITTLYVSHSYQQTDPEYGISKFTSIIDAVNSITNASNHHRYKIIVEAGTDATPIIYDEWNTVYAGHVSSSDSYVGLIVPAYVTITTTDPEYPNRTVCYFDGHSGINDTMTYDDAYKKSLFHLSGKCFDTTIEGLTLRAKDVRYAFHAESNVDAYQMTWYLKNCIIDWQGSPHGQETGWFGHAVGIGIGYGGTGIIRNCKWINRQSYGNGITGHTNGWNPYIPQLPTMPGATLEIINCDIGGYNVSLGNAVDGNELNNIIKFHNVINCQNNTSSGWDEILEATHFTNRN